MITFFPGAGSFGGDAPPGTRAVKYPGRFGTDPASSFDDLVRGCTEQAGTVLFGHSFGAYVACAVAASLGDSVEALVVSGANARVHVPSQAISTPSEALAYLDALGALADAPSDEWRSCIAETAMHDLRLLAEFDVEAVGPLRCPVVAVRGDRDPLTTEEGVRGWENRTSGPFTAHVLAGGHSDLLTGEEIRAVVRNLGGWFPSEQGGSHHDPPV